MLHFGSQSELLHMHPEAHGLAAHNLVKYTTNARIVIDQFNLFGINAQFADELVQTLSDLSGQGAAVGNTTPSQRRWTECSAARSRARLRRP